MLSTLMLDNGPAQISRSKSIDASVSECGQL